MSVGTLYHSNWTRSCRVYWLILELHLDVEIKEIALEKGETRTAEYLKLNPAGKVPAFVDKDVTLFASSAICFYLLDKYDRNFKFGGAPGTPQRANVYKWGSYVSSSVDDVVVPIFLHKVLFPEQIRNRKIVEDNTIKFEQELAPVLRTAIKSTKYFGGDEFSAVDTLSGYILGLALKAGILDKFPDLKQYTQLISERAFYKKLHSS